jgi:hypothetical protein
MSLFLATKLVGSFKDTLNAGVDYDETFSLVIKPATIRSVLSIVVSHAWPIHQLDVKNAFLHGHLEETVYCQHTPGFIDPSAPDSVCLLWKSLYGLKQAPHAWYQWFASYLTTLGFTSLASDVSLFVYKNDSPLAYLLLYVDDIIHTTSSFELLHSITSRLSSKFAMTDLSNLSYFLGILITQSTNALHLSQWQYALDLLKHACMAECHATTTPVDTRAKLSASDGPSISDPSDYQSILSALQYLTLTWSDISYIVQ